jgi:hypothetical protein
MVQPAFSALRQNQKVTCAFVTSPGDHALNQRAASHQQSQKEFSAICLQIEPLLRSVGELQEGEGVLDWAMRTLINHEDQTQSPTGGHTVSISTPADHPYRIVAMAIDQLLAKAANGLLDRETPTDARNKFCYEQWQGGKSYMQIFIALKDHPEWEQLSDEKAVRGPIHSWAKKHSLPVRKGERGKPRRAARG